MTNRANPTTALLLILCLMAAPMAAIAAEETPHVNINTATAEQLAYLPRVGPAVAQRILEYREKNGGFEEPKELMLVQGIGEKTFELIEPYVAVEGETTLQEKVRTSSERL